MKAKPQYEMACMAAKFKKVQAQKVSNLTYINCNVPHKSQKGHLVAEWLKAFLSIKVSHFCLLITLFYHFKCVFFVFFNLLFTHMAYFCSIILIILIPFCEAQRAPSLQKCDTCSYLTSAHTQNLSHLFPLRIIPHDVSCGTVCSQLWGRKVPTTMPLTHADTLKWSWRSMEEKEAVLDEFCLICSPSVITTLPSLLLTSCLLSLIPQDTTRVTNTAVELQWWQIKQRDWIHYNTTAYRGLYQQENSNTNVISAETRSHLSIM